MINYETAKEPNRFVCIFFSELLIQCIKTSKSISPRTAQLIIHLFLEMYIHFTSSLSYIISLKVIIHYALNPIDVNTQYLFTQVFAPFQNLLSQNKNIASGTCYMYSEHEKSVRYVHKYSPYSQIIHLIIHEYNNNNL